MNQTHAPHGVVLFLLAVLVVIGFRIAPLRFPVADGPGQWIAALEQGDEYKRHDQYKKWST
jgi:hypothetical protein